MYARTNEVLEPITFVLAYSTLFGFQQKHDVSMLTHACVSVCHMRANLRMFHSSQCSYRITKQCVTRLHKTGDVPLRQKSLLGAHVLCEVRTETSYVMYSKCKPPNK
jgi:hypothetical protein